MKLTNFSLLLILVATLAFSTGCKKDKTDPTPTSQFESKKVGSDEMEIITDTKAKLVWVNDSRGCFAGIIEPGGQCDSLMFAGRSDWRTPTPAELSGLIKAITAEEKKLNYINASCALMSTNEATWVFTENATSPGTMTTMKPGNAGLRCVVSL